MTVMMMMQEELRGDGGEKRQSRGFYTFTEK